jgi:cytidyltransferase-like protein
MKVDRPGAARLLTQPETAAFVATERAAGRRIVFTNGVFDLLHPGHVRYLQAARALGDVLIVGLNADERAELLAALACVDAVVIFGEDIPDAIIRLVQPDVLVKGADWPADQIVGRDTVEARGGKVVRMPVEEGFSTTALLERIRRAGA